jgi:hypothetical protein
VDFSKSSVCRARTPLYTAALVNHCRSDRVKNYPCEVSFSHRLLGLLLCAFYIAELYESFPVLKYLPPALQSPRRRQVKFRLSRRSGVIISTALTRPAAWCGSHIRFIRRSHACRVVKSHHASLVARLAAVVRCAEHRHTLFVGQYVVAFRYALVGA